MPSLPEQSTPIQPQISQSPIPSVQINPQQSEPTIPRQKKWEALAVAGISLFEIVFVLSLLFLIFGILNYFNILQLSTIFPKLSFLPHFSQPVQETTLAPQVNFPTRDAHSVQLIDYIKQTLRPAYLPFNISQPSFMIQHRANLYAADWTIKNTTASFSLITNAATNDIVELKFVLGPLPPAIIATSAAEQLTAKYFQQALLGTFTCKSVKSFSYCEKFAIQPNQKTSYGIIKTTDDKTISLFGCQIPISSVSAQRTSCIMEK